MKRIVFLAIVALVLALSLPLTSLAAGPQAEEKVTLVIARNIDDAITNDPNRLYEWTTQMTQMACYEGLVEIRPPDLTKPIPKLAESWEISEDGMTYTFHLRKDVKFASGNPLTAEDVRFSFMRLKNLKDNPAFLAEKIKEIEVVDDYTVKITLTEPSAPFLYILTAPTLAIIDSKVVKEHGGTDAEDADKTDTAKEWLDQNSAGSGPFILTGWTPKTEIVLEKNPNYWGEPAKIDKIIVKHVADSSSQVQLLQRGDVDVAQDIDLDLVDQIKADPNITLITGQTINLIYMAITPNAELSKELAQKSVRQAIAYAIDYAGITDYLMMGYSAQPPSVIPVGMLGVDPEMARKRDVEKAKALLSEAGYPDGFFLDFVYPTGTMLGVPFDPLAAKLQSDLAEAGIKLNLQPKEFSVWISQYRGRELAITLGGWSPDYPDPHNWAEPFGSTGGGVCKRIRWDDVPTTDLVKQAYSTSDPEERAKLYGEIQEILMDEATWIPLVQPQSLVAISKEVKGYEFHPVYWVDLYGLSKG